MGAVTNVNLVFCRKFLTVTFREVQAFEPRARARDAAVIKLVSFRNTYFFELPDRPWYRGHFSWTGRADNAFHAKALGWSDWLHQHKLEEKPPALSASLPEG